MPQVFSSRSPRLGKPERFSTSPACQRAGKEKTLREPNHPPLTAYFQECGMPSVVPSYLRLVIEMLSSQEQVHSRDHSAQPQRSFPSVLNQRPSLPSLLPPPPWLKPRCSRVPSEAASILWVSGNFNTLLPESGPQTNDYPAIVLGAQGACQQICESLWLLSHEFSGYILTLLPPLWRFFFLTISALVVTQQKGWGKCEMKALTHWMSKK